MKLIIDRAVPFIEGVFEPFADEVRYMEGSEISHDDLIDTDAIIIRTRTKCTASLLEGTAVKLISTATIGTDHIDIPWCESHGIMICNAAGCNAGGVMNYVFSALYGAAARNSMPLFGTTLGIIGVGSVGSRVEAMARQLGFKVLLCDPPRAEKEGSAHFCSLDYLLENSDIVTMHVPLNNETRRMADASFFAKMREGAIFINAARGEIVVDDDLIDAIPHLGPVIIDTWNHEPNVNKTLLDKVAIGTPHIAGYSYQGKQIGCKMAVRAVARFFGISELYEFFPPARVKELDAVKLDVRGKTQGEIAAIMQYNYPIFTDDFLFRSNPGAFEYLRENYNFRREFFID